MGEIEKRVKTRARKQNIQRAVLGAIGVAGIIAVAAVAPNALQLLALGSIGRKGSYRVNNALGRLLDRGDIERKTFNGKPAFVLSAKGQARLMRLTLAEMSQKQRRWDKRWRIVIFDIPEKYRGSRDRLRVTLTEIGFLKLQDSVWIYPHDCEDLIQLLKTDYMVGKNVLYIVSEHVENDQRVKNHFNIK